MTSDSYSQAAPVPARAAVTMPRGPRRIGGYGEAVTVALVALIAMHTLSVIHSWWLYLFVNGVASGTPFDSNEARLIGRVGDLVAGLNRLYFLATVILFLTWLWRARRNAEALCTAEHAGIELG